MCKGVSPLFNMDTDFILKQVQCMRPSSFSVKEHQLYQAEKMLLRQFMLMKQKYQIPIFLSVKDMKDWLLDGRSFLEEFQEISKRAEARKLLLAELAWTSARRLCLNQMEQELREELRKEQGLSLHFGRKVTLEGHRMFLSVIRPKAERDVWSFLCHLSNKLLSSFTGSHTSKRNQRALLAKLQRTTSHLMPQIVGITLKFILDEPGPAEVRSSPAPVEGSDRSPTSALRSRIKAASTQIGKLLADAAATCFCLDTPFTKARLLSICTSVARDMVKAIYKRFLDRSRTFHLMDFDESFFIAREAVICIVEYMEGRVQSAVHRWALHQLSTQDKMTHEVCCVVTPERTGENKDKQGKRGVWAFFSRMWQKIKRVPTEE